MVLARVLQAGVQQFKEWGDCDQGRHILIAVTRYLAAHFPTQRALMQTADIASRLMHGGELHREAQAVGSSSGKGPPPASPLRTRFWPARATGWTRERAKQGG
jgi:hypothetical protein